MYFWMKHRSSKSARLCKSVCSFKSLIELFKQKFLLICSTASFENFWIVRLFSLSLDFFSLVLVLEVPTSRLISVIELLDHCVIPFINNLSYLRFDWRSKLESRSNRLPQGLYQCRNILPIWILHREKKSKNRKEEKEESATWNNTSKR